MYHAHGDGVVTLPPKFQTTAFSVTSKFVVAYESRCKTRFGVQFHPEVCNEGLILRFLNTL